MAQITSKVKFIDDKVTPCHGWRKTPSISTLRSGDAYMYQWTGQSIIHYSVAIIGAMASEITSLTIVYSTIYSDTVQRKYQSSMSLAFVRGIPRTKGQ